MQPELRRQIRNTLLPLPPSLLLVPTWLRKICVQPGNRRLIACKEIGVGSQLLQPIGRQRGENLQGIMVGGMPQQWINGAEELADGGIPNPVEVVGKLVQTGKWSRKGMSDRERENWTHLRDLIAYCLKNNVQSEHREHLCFCEQGFCQTATRVDCTADCSASCRASCTTAGTAPNMVFAGPKIRREEEHAPP